MYNYFNKNDIQIRIAICGVHMAESFLTGLVFTFIVLVAGVCKLKHKKKTKNNMKT